MFLKTTHLIESTVSVRRSLYTAKGGTKEDVSITPEVKESSNTGRNISKWQLPQEAYPPEFPTYTEEHIVFLGFLFLSTAK